MQEASDRWETEEFAAATGEVLKLWKKVLVGESSGESLAGMSNSLIPEEYKSAAKNNLVFQVKNGSGFSGKVNSISEALVGVRSQFEAPLELIEFKTIGVSFAEDSRKTKILVQLANQERQINAVWHAKWSSDDPVALLDLQVDSYEEVDKKIAGGFEDVTGFVIGDQIEHKEQITRGLDHWLSRLEMSFGLEMSSSHGLSIADVNGDGLDDVYLSSGGGLPNRLFLHQKDGTVRDGGAEAGVDFLDHTHSSLFLDFDNDGDQDLALAMSRGVLILENSQAVFTVRETKLFPSAVPYSLSAADYNQDGKLDLFVNAYTARKDSRTDSDFLARPVPYHDAENGGRNELFRNEGEFKFRNVTKECGLDEGNVRFSYSSTWEDFDRDGDLDLYVANDFGSNNLYVNQLFPSGKPSFKEMAEESGVRDIAAGMSTSWGDYDNDGLVDLYVGNMFSSAGNRIATQDRFKTGQDELKGLYQRHARGNSLFKNMGNGSFSDVTVESGASMGRWAGGSLFTDIDNDGWEDLLVANGYVTQEDTGDL